MDVSIIIVNYNTRDLILQCLQSIYEQTSNVEFEVIVVDNDSKDDSASTLREQFPQVRVIEAGTNLGFGRANNLGAKQAKGEYLFLLNSDTILLNNSVKLFLDTFVLMRAEHKIGVLGGLLLDANKQITGSWGEIPTFSNQILSALKLMPKYSTFNAKQEVEFTQSGFTKVGYVTGADMFMLRSLFDEIGGFDEKIFLYYEETDMQRRIMQKGFSQYVISSPSIIHLEGKSTLKSLSNWKRITVTNSLFYYIHKHYCFIIYLLFRLIYLLLRIPNLFDWRYSLKERKQYLECLVSHY